MDGLAARHAALRARYHSLGQLHLALAKSGFTAASDTAFASLQRIFAEASNVYEQMMGRSK